MASTFDDEVHSLTMHLQFKMYERSQLSQSLGSVRFLGGQGGHGVTVIFAQDVLYRGADASIVWPEILATALIGSVYFGYALYRFRRVIFSG